MRMNLLALTAVAALSIPPAVGAPERGGALAPGAEGIQQRLSATPTQEREDKGDKRNDSKARPDQRRDG